MINLRLRILGMFIFLELEVHRTYQGFFINQHKYTKDLIEVIHCYNYSSVEIFLELYTKLLLDSCILFSDPSIFRRLVSSIFYDTPGPNIFFSPIMLTSLLRDILIGLLSLFLRSLLLDS